MIVIQLCICLESVRKINKTFRHKKKKKKEKNGNKWTFHSYLPSSGGLIQFAHLHVSLFPPLMWFNLFRSIFASQVRHSWENNLRFSKHSMVFKFLQFFGIKSKCHFFCGITVQWQFSWYKMSFCHLIEPNDVKLWWGIPATNHMLLWQQNCWVVSTVLSQKTVLALIFSQSPSVLEACMYSRWVPGFHPGTLTFSLSPNTNKWFCYSKLPSRIVNMLTLMDGKSI